MDSFETPSYAPAPDNDEKLKPYAHGSITADIMPIYTTHHSQVYNMASFYTIVSIL